MSSALDEDALAAIAASELGIAPPAVIRELTAGATRRHIAAHSVVHHEAEDAPHLELVISGLLRVHVSNASGRTMTVRYCRAGSLLGVATLYTSIRPTFGIQALADTELLSLRPGVVRSLADRDLDLARALLTETSRRVMSFVAELSGQAFSSVSQRIARHLLDLASDQRGPDLLLVAISQQDLADAVGSVREVVVRVLRDLRAQGVVETGRAGILIRDPEQLVRLSGAGWNESS